MTKVPETQSTYVYDGSFAGMLCCIYESFDRHEMPYAVTHTPSQQMSMFEQHAVASDEDKAARVAGTVRERISAKALRLIQHAYMSAMEDKELCALRFVRLGLQAGARVTSMLAHPCVCPLWKAEMALFSEVHAFKEFARFSSHGDILVATIEPRNMVLPILVRHFAVRFRNEKFVIYDAVHRQVALYAEDCMQIAEGVEFEPPPTDREEENFRRLWQRYLEVMPVEGRDNPRCQMAHMPKRYWKNMPEMADLAEPALPARRGKNAGP